MSSLTADNGAYDGLNPANSTAITVDEAERLLDIVVDELQRLSAGEGTHGILVTKTGPGH
ncbi:hypothetical protein [Crystallibacter crystallopoietes]|uniref:hypothetical protein n=1 Tax=Crystallibacter crystallopoietes TaxID=37928 RepID=UPI0012377FEF|nr:hypothetical protein [Arthrobacter crystallopoietes]